LNASGSPLEILLDFDAPRLQLKRIVFDSHRCSSVTSVDNSASDAKNDGRNCGRLRCFLSSSVWPLVVSYFLTDQETVTIPGAVK
jgi:hypothetical protein